MTKRKSKHIPRSLQCMTGSAFLIAISVVLTRFLSPYLAIAGSNTLRIGLGTIPIIVSSIIFGPFYGGIVGAGSDVIGAIFFPAGPYNPCFTISSMLQGILPYFAIKLFTGKPKLKMAITGLALASLVIVNSVFLINNDSYKISSDLIINFNKTGKVVFISTLATIYSSVIVISYFINRKYKDKNTKSNIKIEDTFFACLINEVVINVFISSIWKMIYFDLPYLTMSFASSLILILNVPVKSVILFTLFIPLTKIYPYWAIKSKEVITLSDINLIANPLKALSSKLN